jgi:hypothetical protein
MAIQPQDKQMPVGGEMEIQIAVGDAEQADEQMYADMAPQSGNVPFSRKALNNLVKATNRLLPLFGQDPNYPEFAEDITVFPTDFVRILAMFQGATNEAVSNDVLDVEMDWSMDTITDDQSINALAGKLTSLAQSKPFKQFLKEQPGELMEQEEEEAPSVEEEGPKAPEEMTDEEMNNLFAGRM